jgi:hypothetical protein
MFIEIVNFWQILINLGEKPGNYVKKIAQKSAAGNVQNSSDKLYTSGSQTFPLAKEIDWASL